MPVDKLEHALEERDFGMTIYPPFHEVAAPLGGKRSTVLVQAIRIAAHVLAKAALEVADKFTQAEWAIIYRALRGAVDISPVIMTPQEVMAQLIEAAHFTRGLGKRQEVEKITKVLRSLDYLQAWAVTIAVQWREFWEEHQPREAPSDADSWWRISYREEKGLPITKRMQTKAKKRRGGDL